MFTINNTVYYNPSTGELNFTRGGFQGGEGIDNGAEWYIENVFEELNIPNEYYYNDATNELYFYYNNSDNGSNPTPPPNDINLVSTNLKVLFNISAGLNNQNIPVKNITIQGIIFRDARFTFLDNHALPSAGDWGLQTQGAINIESSEHIIVNSSLFTRMDGNAIFINGYNRYVSVINNDFEFIGDSVIASLGYTSSPDNNALIPNAGPDGRNGNQPRYNYIANNMVREIGLWQVR